MQQPTATQWEASPIRNARSSHSVGCINTRGLGCSLPRDIHRGAMGPERMQPSRKHFRTEYCEIGHPNIHTSEKCKNDPHSNGQHDSLSIFNQNGREGTKNQTLTQISKEIWEYLISKRIMITAEYLPTHLNTQADWESRHVKDSSEWKLNLIVFKEICQTLGQPSIDLFASRLTKQMSTYMSWKPDPKCRAVDALQQNWTHMFPYAFPPLTLIGKVSKKVITDKTRLIIITPIWHSHPWYPILLNLSIRNPLLLPHRKNLFQW